MKKKKKGRREERINGKIQHFRRKNSHVTVIRLGSSQEGQPEITSKVENVEKTSNVENVDKTSVQDVKCVTVVSSNPEPAFKLPPPPLSTVTTVSTSTVGTTVSGIPLLPPPPGPSKSRTAGNNHQVSHSQLFSPSSC
jgi:hypothetical protein